MGEPNSFKLTERDTCESWENLTLSQEVDTPSKRLDALVNVAKNPAHSLVLFALTPKEWMSVSEIRKELEVLSGRHLITDGAVRTVLGTTIEPVGAAAYSPDDKRWSLTSFGNAIKPALLFFWENCVDLGLKGTDIFGRKSDKQKGENGEYTTSPGNSLRVLEALTHPDVSMRKQLVDKLKFSPKMIENMEDRWRVSGIMEGEKIAYRGNKAEYVTTDDGKKIPEWDNYSYYDKNGDKHVFRVTSKHVKEAVDWLISTQGYASTRDVQEYLATKLDHPLNPSSVAKILSFFVKNGMLANLKFGYKNLSELKLTVAGQLFVEEVVSPLTQWCIDIHSVPQIVDKQREIGKNSDSAKTLYTRMAEAYVTQKMSDEERELLLKRALDMVDAFPGKFTRTELGRMLGINHGTGIEFVSALIKQGRLVEKGEKIGGRLLFPVVYN